MQRLAMCLIFWVRLQPMLFLKIYHNIPWQQDPNIAFERPISTTTDIIMPTPWFIHLFGVIMTPKPMTETLKQIKKRLQQYSDASFTSVLLNLYRDGKDSNGWHADDEPELGINPVMHQWVWEHPGFFTFVIITIVRNVIKYHLSMAACCSWVVRHNTFGNTKLRKQQKK